MYKSIIILLALIWLFCMSALTYARIYDQVLPVYVSVISWISSCLLLVVIFIYVRRHRG